MDKDLNPDLSHLKAHVLPDLLFGSLAEFMDQGGEATIAITMEIGVIEMLRGRGSVREHSWCCLPINHKKPPLFTCRKIACKPSLLRIPRFISKHRVWGGAVSCSWCTEISEWGWGYSVQLITVTIAAIIEV